MDLLSEITIAPSYRPEAAALLPAGLRAEVDAYMAARQPATFLATLKQRLLLPQHETLLCGTKYSQPLLNALVFYVGIRVRLQLYAPCLSSSSCSCTMPRLLTVRSALMFPINELPHLLCLVFL